MYHSQKTLCSIAGALFSPGSPWCLSVPLCVLDCSCACLSSAPSSAYIHSTFLGHAPCTLMGLSSSQNAAAIFSHVDSRSRKLPTCFSSSPRAEGSAGAPTLHPSPSACCQPGCALWAALRVHWVCKKAKKKPTPHLHCKDCRAVLWESIHCSSDSAFPVNQCAELLGTTVTCAVQILCKTTLQKPSNFFRDYLCLRHQRKRPTALKISLLRHNFIIFALTYQTHQF